jgi:CBS domain-containing protein
MNVDVTVQDVMDREYVGVSESDDLVDTVEVLLRQEAEAAVVQRGNEHVGVLTHEDVLATLVEGPDPSEASVGDAMTESVPTVSPETRLGVAADKMSTQESGRLVVTSGSEPLGVLSERDLLATRSQNLPSGRESPEDATLVTEHGGEVESGQTNGGFKDQSICEGCGSFASDLSSFNGQLLCTDCRAI